MLSGSALQRVDLFWSNPLGNSTNDYDLYVVDSSGSVISSSTNIQDGQGDPYESISQLSSSGRIVIVKYSGDDRYLYLSTYGGRLQFATSGSTHGHNASGAPNAFCVAATPVASPPVPFVGGSANPVESFSSDGPRLIFFNPDGTAITPGDYSSTGGKILLKPDITAADGVMTVGSGLCSLFWDIRRGATCRCDRWIAVVLQPPPPARYDPLDSDSYVVGHRRPGPDQDSGAGIVMAYPALVGALPVEIANVLLMDANGNSSLDPNECADLIVTLTNLSGQTMSGLSAVLTSPVSEVTIDPEPRSFPDLPPGGITTAATPFRISTSPLLACATNVAFVLQLVSTNQKTFREGFQLGSLSDGPGAPLNFEFDQRSAPDSRPRDRPVLANGCGPPLASGQGESLRLYHPFLRSGSALFLGGPGRNRGAFEFQ